MRFLILVFLFQIGVVDASPRVVTSIAPLHEITAAIMFGIAEPKLIIDAQQSAHDFSFKPSHMRSLQQADLVIWIDRHFEAGFHRVPEILLDTTQQLELKSALEIEGSNGHFWYSPRLLLRSIEIISSRLMQIDRQHQSNYQTNAERLSEAVQSWRKTTRDQWQGNHPRFITDHEFSAHFEIDMGFNAIATIHDQHDTHGGLKDLNRLEHTLRQSPGVCLLTMENPISPLAQSLAQKYHLKVINILQLPVPGQTLPGIIQRLEKINTALHSCY